jgi:hypothetical protein
MPNKEMNNGRGQRKEIYFVAWPHYGKKALHPSSGHRYEPQG